MARRRPGARGRSRRSRARRRGSGSGACGTPLATSFESVGTAGRYPPVRAERATRRCLPAPCAISASTTRTPRRVRPLEPREPGKVGIYACGPTVYARVHVGNARPFVVFSQLKRFLEHEGLEATLVANITDINDKIYDAARAAGRPSAELAEEMTAHYFADTERLGLGRPDHEPLASESVDGIVELIAALVEGGHAYAVERRRLLPRALAARATASSRAATSTRWTRARASRAPSARRTRSTSRSGRRRRRARTPPGTRRGGRGAPAGTSSAPRWPSSYLGVDFDIHGGGIDLVFPHHENEAAQTLAGARQAARARVDAQRDAPARRREDVQVRGQHPRAGRGARRGRRRRARPVLLRRPLPPADRLLRRAPRGGRALAPRGSARRGGG